MGNHHADCSPNRQWTSTYGVDEEHGWHDTDELSNIYHSCEDDTHVGRLTKALEEGWSVVDESVLRLLATMLLS